MMPVCSLLRPHMCAPAASPALLRMLPPLGPALPAARRLPCASPPLAACGSARCLTNRAFKEIQDEAADKKIVRTPTLFRPLYSAKDVGAVKPVHFKPQTFSDRVASIMIHLTRRTFDFVTRYHHPPIFPQVKDWKPKHVVSPGYKVRLPATEEHESPTQTMDLVEMRKQGISMTPAQWMVRIVFLETIAGIPGLVAAACRHLGSLRLMRRDKGWIHTLLEDSENERMHLLTAMQYVGSVGPFMRLMIVAAQGVYWNMFFAAYLVAPKAAHRFVGFLEEEAVITYTAVIQDIEQGRLPEWENLPAVDIAKEYWDLPDTATIVDVMYAIRADEATHRFVNHTLGSLDPNKDFNPFANHIPSADLRGGAAGLTREEAHDWAQYAQRDAEKEPNSVEQPSVMASTSTTEQASEAKNIEQASQEPEQQGEYPLDPNALNTSRRRGVL